MTNTDDPRPRLRHGSRRAWATFRDWRRVRPFWAGCHVMLAGVLILAPPYATLRLSNLVITISTIGGVSSLLIGVLLTLIAVSLWLRPQFRLVAGVSAVLLGLVALVTANLGGFLVGTLLAIIGGALAVSWHYKTPRHRLDPIDEPDVEESEADLDDISPDHLDPDPIDDDSPTVTIPRYPVSGPRNGPTLTVVVALTATATLLAAAVAGPDANAATAAPARPSASQGPDGRAWVLKASKLEMNQLRFHGIASTELNGQPVDILRFTAGELKITDLVQLADIGGGRTMTVTAARNSVSTISAGPIELFTQRLQGKLKIGPIEIPMDLSPTSPPPLVPPSITYTNVTVNNTDLRGGTMTIPGADIKIS
jgi:hypothetical protein